MILIRSLFIKHLGEANDTFMSNDFLKFSKTWLLCIGLPIRANQVSIVNIEILNDVKEDRYTSFPSRIISSIPTWPEHSCWDLSENWEKEFHI
jgi:hypothetical protein